MEVLKPADLYVLDSWPLLEWLQEREPSTSLIDNLLELAFGRRTKLLISRLNYGEVIYTCRKKFPVDEAIRFIAAIETLPIEVISVDDFLVDAAVELKGASSASYADCFAAALAMRYTAPLVTGDPELQKIAMIENLRLEWIGA